MQATLDTARQARARVLCVDDEPNILRSLRWLLQKQYDVDVAASGADALAMVCRADYDVVISDQRMPGMIGSELLREVRKVAPRAMRILLTGYSDMQAVLSSANEGEVYRFLNKPWNIQELQAVVGEAARIARHIPPPPPPAPADVAAAQVAALPRSREAILIVEDDVATSSMISECIGDAAPVLVAADIADAVLAFEGEQRIGIVIANMRVADVDATRMIKLVKQAYPDIVTVVYTGENDAVDVISLINHAQVFRFLSKPLKPCALRLALTAASVKRTQLRDNRALGQRHAVQALAADSRESLARDVERVARAKSPTQPGTFLERLGAGFRRLLGAA